jgi:LacI family transcriptional regulator
MPVSIRDVARLAGVSVTTVSRVVNDKAAVRKDTRQRVVEAMTALNWTPRDGVHGTVGNKTHTVALLLPDLYGEFFAELIRGINQAAARSGHHLLVSGSHSGDPGGLETVLRTLRGRVDGLIVLAADRHGRILLDRLGQSVPVVLVDSATSDCDLPSVTVDNFGGARAMTRHLLGLGHRRIAFVGGPPGNHDAGERQRGWRKAFAGARVPVPEDLLFPGDFTELSGHSAGARIARLRPLPDAVFAANDSMAFGCLSAFFEARLRVPRDLALAGFDDFPMAPYMTPPLTSVRVPIAALGESAMERLKNLMGKEVTDEDWRRDVLPAKLVIRASCGAPPAARS